MIKMATRAQLSHMHLQATEWRKGRIILFKEGFVECVTHTSAYIPLVKLTGINYILNYKRALEMQLVEMFQLSLTETRQVLEMPLYFSLEVRTLAPKFFSDW